MKQTRRDRIQKFLLLAVWLIIITLYALQVITAEVFRTDFFDIHQVIYFPFVRLFAGWLLILLFVIPIYNMLRPRKGVTKAFGFVIAAILFGALYSVISSFLLYLVSKVTPLELPNALFPGILQEVLDTFHHTIMYFLLFLAVLMSIDYVRARLEASENERRLEESLSKARLNMLKNQLQPHFLFNALNSISSSIEDNQQDAQEMIAEVSNLLRRSLQTDYRQPIPLEKEIEFLNLYLQIEKRRFEHQLILEWEISEAAKEYYILPFILQPIAENAIKHGFSNTVKQLTLKINGSAVDRELHLAVSNNGKPLTNHEEGIGLRNVRTRLHHVYGENFSLNLEQRQGWVVTSISISK